MRLETIAFKYIIVLILLFIAIYYLDPPPLGSEERSYLSPPPLGSKEKSYLDLPPLGREEKKSIIGPIVGGIAGFGFLCGMVLSAFFLHKHIQNKEH